MSVVMLPPNVASVNIGRELIDLGARPDRPVWHPHVLGPFTLTAELNDGTTFSKTGARPEELLEALRNFALNKGDARDRS